MHESVWARAWRDTKASLHNFWFWLAELVIAAIAGSISPGLVPVAVVGLLGLLFFVQAVLAPYRQRDEARSALAVRPGVDELRVGMKDALGAATKEGTALYVGKASKHAAEAWVTKTHHLIEAALGSGEAARFLDDAGYTFYVNQHTTPVDSWLDGRLRRLNELIARIDLASIRPDYEPEAGSNE